MQKASPGEGPEQRGQCLGSVAPVVSLELPDGVGLASNQLTAAWQWGGMGRMCLPPPKHTPHLNNRPLVASPHPPEGPQMCLQVIKRPQKKKYRLHQLLSSITVIRSNSLLLLLLGNISLGIHSCYNLPQQKALRKWRVWKFPKCWLKGSYSP